MPEGSGIGLEVSSNGGDSMNMQPVIQFRGESTAEPDPHWDQFLRLGFLLLFSFLLSIEDMQPFFSNQRFKSCNRVTLLCRSTATFKHAAKRLHNSSVAG